MTPEYNEYVLSTAYHSGWITIDQYQAAAAALQAMPHLSAIDFLLEQTIINPGQAEGLRQAVDEAASAAQVATPKAPAVQVADEPPAATPEKPRADVEVTSSPDGLPDGMGVTQLLRLGFDAGASDVHLGISAPPLMRRHGTFQPLYHNAPVLTPAHTETLIKSFLNPLQLEALEKNKGLDFSYDVPGLARFRANVVQQRKGLDAVFRIINTQVRTMDELGLPEQLKVLTQYHNGLVLVTGAVGCGKSTTLAAMVQEVNTHRRDHIITLEDPIEYVFVPDGCQITQREVHAHTESFSAALRASLREDPDVIIVGEMRDLETISLAITASETGHLVIATLHTSNAARTLDRVLDAFPVEQQGQIRTMVSESLRGIISQQLIPRADGNGRAVALEIMVNTPAVANLIREAKTFMLPGIIQIGKKLGMKLMDDSLFDLMEKGVISPHEAFDRAEQKKNFEPFLK
ncbi:MAG TPA: type IV pilus twitching motility protein PilT [Candidatus Methylacidiphilales bacterium]|jgi:twitching motility protein PilT|nr:type IV pilus twitching motility protein PilT [Candidatus Methylacidiphilales bacterium]